MNREKPTFDLTAILPTFNFGPYIHEVKQLIVIYPLARLTVVLRAQATKERGVGSTPSMFLYTLTNGGTSEGNSWNFVDVRDVALLHVLALSTPEAGGERILSTAGAIVTIILQVRFRD